jgi:hypothetical protein
MNVVLLRVGIDRGCGGMLGPLFADGSFEFIPIYDERWPERRTYGNTRGRHGRRFIEYFPPSRQESMRQVRLHNDPEFDTFTYGDPTQPKRSLRRLQPGDLLVLYVGLQGWGDCRMPAGLFLVGYFEVEHAGLYPELVAEMGTPGVRRLFRNNPHVRYADPAHHDKLVLVKGSEKSRLLNKAVRLSALKRGVDGGGRPVFVLDRAIRKHCGSFSKLNAIQRSIPRWVAGDFADKAAAFVRALD